MDRVTTRTLTPRQPWLLGALCWLISGTVLADPGDIIIQRDVEPRTLSQHWYSQDSNPTRVNPGQSTQELSDADFAQVTSRSTGSTQNSTLYQPLHNLNQQVQRGTGVSRSGAGAGNTVSNTVNRALSQGLKPLNSLGGLAP